MPRTARNNPDFAKGTNMRRFRTALYIRLSREDGDKEESDSIGNQRDMLLSYIANDEQFSLYDIYIDDGFTGTNFNRPAFARMIGDMEKKRIDCVIVKDLSRFGRDYIGVGDYEENIFPRFDVRFIAVNDHIDTLCGNDGADSILVPFKNIINEQYARDISRKVRSALDTKRRRGKFIGAFACYGYQKDPGDKNRLVVDEEAARVVREIFRLFLSGTAKLTIASSLNDKEIPCPSEYKRRNGQKYTNSNRLEKTCYWTHSTVHRILNNEMYLGNMVQHTQTTKNLKQKKNMALKKSEWIVVPGTHEPIIDHATWEAAQNLLRADIKKSPFTGGVHLFAGILKCGGCGRAMKKRTSGKNIYYICGTYKLYGKKLCTSHSVDAKFLEDCIRSELKAQLNRSVDFEKLEQDVLEQSKRSWESRDADKKIAGLQKKLEKVLTFKRGLYEDFKNGILTQEEYFSLKKDYEAQDAQCRAQLGEAELSKKEQDPASEEQLVSELVSSCRDLSSLSRELLVSLVKTVLISDDKRIVIEFYFKPPCDSDKPQTGSTAV